MSSRFETPCPLERQDGENAECEFIDSRIIRISNNNAFGHGKIVNITSKTNKSDTGSQFMSRIEFKTATIIEEDGTKREVSLVIKIQIESTPYLADFTRCMFTNEVKMFTDVLPSLAAGECALVPRCFYAVSTESPTKDIIIMEDLTKQQFHLLEQTITDKNRMSFLVHKLGQFHGLSYRAKKRDPFIVDHLKTVLKPTKHLFFMKENGPKPPERVLSAKIAERLIEKSNDVPRLIQSITGRRYILLELRAPEEPFAAVVHGDLFFGNIFVRTCKDTGETTEARFIDLQTSSYSDPIFDLSFLIFMSASIELIERHWDDFVTDYWNGITSIEPLPGFDLEDAKKNIERKALSGFIDSCFFLPLTMTPKEELNMDLFSGPKENVDMSQVIQNILTVAPAEASDKLVSVLQFCINKGFVKKALEFYDE